jgi:hypothetical protein
MDRLRTGLQRNMAFGARCRRAHGRPAELWVEAKRGFSELLGNKKGFGSKGGNYKGYVRLLALVLLLVQQRLGKAPAKHTQRRKSVRRETET